MWWGRRRAKGWRKWLYWSRYVARLELAFVAALILLPLLGAPFVPNDADDNNSSAYSAYNENERRTISIWALLWNALHRFIASHHDDIDALSTVVIAAFTAILAWSTIRLWRETERLAGGADEQADKTRIAAEAAQKSASVAEKALYSLEADALNSQFGQIKREADALAAQVGQMKRQATASEQMASSAQGQLSEAQAQTRAISAQTDAIKRGSAAQIKSAKAQERSAVVEIEARRPALDVADIQFSGLKTPPDKDGLVPFAFKMDFVNIGSNSISSPDVKIVINFLPGELPPKPDFRLITVDAGKNHITAAPSTTFGQTEPSQLKIPKATADDVNSGKRNAYVFGTVDYRDLSGEAHIFCFAEKVLLKDGAGGVFAETGDPAYHCNK
jgi:hypothetical protein